jgi:hypothetical protein
MDLKRESIDDKRSKIRTTNKLNISRNIKSAPTMHRSKSQLVLTTKRKEKKINSFHPTPLTNPVYK